MNLRVYTAGEVLYGMHYAEAVTVDDRLRPSPISRVSSRGTRPVGAPELKNGRCSKSTLRAAPAFKAPDRARENRGNVLRNRRMYVHRAPKRRVGRLGVHDVENADGQPRRRRRRGWRPRNLVAVSVNDDFDKPLRFALLDGARRLAHWPPANQDASSRLLPRLGLRQTGAAERRINVRRRSGRSRSLTRRRSSSRRLAATISKSL